MRILPTGAGEAHTFDIAPVQVDRSFVSWMPNAKEFVFLGHQAVASPGAYRVSIDVGLRSLTTQKGAQFWNRVSPNGKFVLQGAGIGLDWGQNTIVELGSGQVPPCALAGR